MNINSVNLVKHHFSTKKQTNKKNLFQFFGRNTGSLCISSYSLKQQVSILMSHLSVCFFSVFTTFILRQTEKHHYHYSNRFSTAFFSEEKHFLLQNYSNKLLQIAYLLRLSLPGFRSPSLSSQWISMCVCMKKCCKVKIRHKMACFALCFICIKMPHHIHTKQLQRTKSKFTLGHQHFPQFGKVGSFVEFVWETQVA